MIFVASLLQEKNAESNLFLVAFIDLTKAFDTVNRDLLWKVLSKFGCPPHFLQMLRAFHNSMSARVTVGGHESDPFDVLVGVKQGCVLAPVLLTYSLLPLLWSSAIDSLQMLEFPSTSGWMAICSISDGCRRRPKSQETPFSTCSMQTMQKYPATQQPDSNIVLTYLLPHINVLD